MAEQGMLVAARFLDGRVVKGRTVEFRPEGVLRLNEEGASSPTSIPVNQLKAVFFIKSAAGNPEHEERKAYGGPGRFGKKIWVEFLDGEELAGHSVSYTSSGSDGFNFFPTDPRSNIEMVYVIRSSVKKILLGGDAERAARKYRMKKHVRNALGISPEKWEQFVSSR